MNRRPLVVGGVAAVLAAAGIATTPFAASATDSRGDFVTRSGSTLLLHGKKFSIAGTNNYYLTYKSEAMVDDVLGDAAAAKFNVVRTWGWVDIGNQDGTGGVAGKPDGVYYQYWDGTQPAYNDGADGLAHLDYAIAKAKELGLKLVIPFTNNWSDFGGMDQYVRWAGGQYHDDFFTNETIKGWYKAWIAHLLNHVNPQTGLAYKDDPTIMTWELGNEPRCKGSGLPDLRELHDGNARHLGGRDDPVHQEHRPEVCTTIGNAGKILAGKPGKFPPVADNDTVVTPFETAVTVDVVANDIAYGATITASTIDLDATATGRQRSLATAGGTFAIGDDAIVTFTPATGFFGKATATYTVKDSKKRTSNTATITVTVKPNPAAAVTLYSFEDGVEGWAPGNWQENAGTVEQTTSYATAGSHGLQVNSVEGGWFGATLAEPMDFTTHGTLTFDLKTASAGTSRAVALQIGEGYAWCQSPFQWITQETETHVTLDIASDLSGCGDGLSDVRGMLIFFNPGTFVIDSIVVN